MTLLCKKKINNFYPRLRGIHSPHYALVMNSCLHNFSWGREGELQGLRIADADKRSAGKSASEFSTVTITPIEDKEGLWTASRQRVALMYDVTWFNERGKMINSLLLMVGHRGRMGGETRSPFSCRWTKCSRQSSQLSRGPAEGIVCPLN